MTEIAFAQTIFSFFQKTNRLGEIPDFLVYGRKHLPSFEPSVVAGVSEHIFNSDELKALIVKHVEETIGTTNVSFQKLSGVADDAIELSKKADAISQVKNSRLKNIAITFLSFLTREGLYQKIDIILQSLEDLYTKYTEEIVITIKTDTAYTPELEDAISAFCIAHAGAKRAVVNQVIDLKQGGGFQVRWRDYAYDGTYRQALQSLK